jgi:hypothetical protein
VREELERLLGHGQADAEVVVRVAVEQKVEIVGLLVSVRVLFCFLVVTVLLAVRFARLGLVVVGSELIEEALLVRHGLLVAAHQQRNEDLDDLERVLAERNDDEDLGSGEALVSVLNVRVVGLVLLELVVVSYDAASCPNCKKSRIKLFEYLKKLF